MPDTLEGAWDAAFCIGNVASHLDAAATARLLDFLSRRLPPGGGLLVQTVNWDALAGRATYRFPDLELGDGVVFEREYRDLGPARTRFATALRDAGRTLFSGEVDLFPRAAADWRALLEGAGFAVVAHHADFAGAPFRADAPGGSVWAVQRR